MFRAIPVGNKLCAGRAAKRYEEQRQQRLRDMKPLVDNRAPHSSTLVHVKQNLKRNQLVSERYNEIERDNKHLMGKMSEMVSLAPEPSSLGNQRSRSLPLLQRQSGVWPSRRREHERIDRENELLLKRLQKVPTATATDLSGEAYKDRKKWMRIKCEYPLLLDHSGSTGRLGVSPQSSPGQSPWQAGDRFDQDAPKALREVLREQMDIGGVSYLLEMATDESILAISACNLESQVQTTLELVVNELNHKRLLSAAAGDYLQIARGLRVDGDALALDLPL